MKFSKKLLATAMMTTALMSPAAAEAAPQSMYKYVDMFAHNPAVQKNFINAMIRNYQRTLAVYNGLISRYEDRFGGASWFKNIVATRDFYVGEIALFESALTSAAPVVEVVKLVNTTTDVDYTTEVKTGAPVVKSTVEKIVEETNNNIVKVFAVVTKVLETETVTTTLKTTTTTKFYSNNTSKASTNTVVDKVEKTYAQETVVDRELVREYAVVVEETPVEEVAETEQPVDGDMGTATLNVLTVDEYLARDDVDLGATETYEAAVLKVNSRINRDYINREGGMRAYGTVLEAVGAVDAWSRGWTGKGSKIAILDTGIDVDHTEFAGRILATECFVGTCNNTNNPETVQDNNRVSHGTHVAGIAAAALDGVGTTGVAPDAELLIAKTAWDNGYYDLRAAAKAIGWADAQGAVVANISGNYNVDYRYKKGLTEINPGEFQLIDNGDSYVQKMISYGYGEHGYAGLLKTNTDYTILSELTKTLADSEMVLVASAGNQRLGFATFPAHYAVYTDDNGDLLFDGRIIVAGNYDLKSGKIASSSNRAGTVCYDTANGNNTCDSDYRIKDFYLMAPGQWVASTDKDGEYRTNSGTSMAAPVITGAVAVIHQMWPHMKGKNIAKLLLDTGNKEAIANYDENIHGQGLLDLEAATRPQGAVGIPTGGRVDGARDFNNTGAIAMSGGANISALEQVMIVDDYARDFYIDANALVAVNDTRTASSVKYAQQGLIPDYYMGFTGGTVIPMSENLTASLNADASNMTIAYNTEGFTVGLQTEENSFLGNVADSALMRVEGSTTAYVGYEFDNGNIFGSAQVGATSLDVDSTSMMKSADTLMSYSATLGAKQTVGATTFGATVAVPVTIAQGNANFEMASGVSTDGTLNYATKSSSLSASNVEVDYGLFMNTNLTENSSIETFVEVRTNYAGTTDTQTSAGIAYKLTF